jgi:rod shape-determining protein MreC
MQRAKSLLPVFIILVVVSLLIFFFFQGFLMKPLQAVTLPVQSWLFTTFSQPIVANQDSEQQIRDENNALRAQIAKLQELERDNKALRDQFQSSNENSQSLLPAKVIGINESQMLIDKGREDDVKIGDIVVVKDNLLGKVEKISPRVSVIRLVTHPSTSFTAITSKTAAIGVVKAQGGDSITVENVVLSDKLEKDDLIKTKGDVDENGGGFPPDLIVGKIVSVNNKASNLFQSAKVKSFINFSTVSTVFIITE